MCEGASHLLVEEYSVQLLWRSKECLFQAEFTGGDLHPGVGRGGGAAGADLLQ